jgi:hypothetical protein
MDKQWFIAQYTEIHDNLSNLEKEITEYRKNKFKLTGDSTILENLKKATHKEIERLNKIREYEREIFNY